VPLRLLALGLLPTLGQLQRQRLQVLVALVLRLRVQLGGLGALLLGLSPAAG
jgi:hypothetical protein